MRTDINSISLGFTQVITPTYCEVVQGEDRLDKIISPWDCESSRLWSLWDMLRVYADDFINIGGTFALISRLLHDAETNKKPFTDEHWTKFRSHLFLLKDECDKMGLKLSAAILLNTIDKLPITHRELEMLMDVIKEEIKSKLFLLISADRAPYYNPDKPIWGAELIDKFADMSEDIAEANNCYALDRHTACIFHLMRIVEKAVQKLANKLDISTIITYDKEWQPILNDIRGKLKILYPKHTDPDRLKYEAMIGHLETVKIAWRNPTMQPKATYTEEEAKSILGAVEIFMKELIKVL